MTNAQDEYAYHSHEYMNICMRTCCIEICYKSMQIGIHGEV